MSCCEAHVAEKRVGETELYGITYEDRLSSGESIAASRWTIPAGILSPIQGFTSPIVSIWVDGGIAGETYTIVNSVDTSNNRVLEETLVVTVC